MCERPRAPVLKKGTAIGYILRTGFSYWDLIFELKIEVMLLQKEPGRNANQHLGRDRIGKETTASCLLDGSTHSNTGSPQCHQTPIKHQEHCSQYCGNGMCHPNTRWLRFRYCACKCFHHSWFSSAPYFVKSVLPPLNCFGTSVKNRLSIFVISVSLFLGFLFCCIDLCSIGLCILLPRVYGLGYLELYSQL